jgi:hypothetical protein
MNQLLAAQHAAVRARGEPADLSEITYPNLPDSENAWLLIARAHKLDDQSSPSHQSTTFPEYQPFPQGWVDAAESSEKANAAVFQLVRQARSLPRSQARRQFPSQGWSYSISNQCGYVARTVCDGAFYMQYCRHDDAESVERLRDVLRILRVLAEEDDLREQYATSYVGRHFLATALAIAADLQRIDANTRQAAVGLIEDLLKEDDQPRKLARAITIDSLRDNDRLAQQSKTAFMLQPLAVRSMLRNFEGAQVLAKAATADNDESASQAMVQSASPRSDVEELVPEGTKFKRENPSLQIPRYSRWFLRDVGDDYLDRRFRSLAERRMIAVSLAMQLYRADHHGAWPTKLEDLVPNYLASVPKDPFHSDGRPLIYLTLRGALPNGGDRRLVGFVPKSSAADNFDSEPMYCWVGRWGDEDHAQYRDLTYWKPVVRRYEEQVIGEASATLQDAVIAVHGTLKSLLNIPDPPGD